MTWGGGSVESLSHVAPLGLRSFHSSIVWVPVPCLPGPRKQSAHTMLQGCNKHMQVPVVLGARPTDLPNKASALLHSLRLETGTSTSLQALLASTVSLTTDLGVEAGLSDFPKVDLAHMCIAPLPANVEDDIGDSLSCAAVVPGNAEESQSDYMFPHTLMVSGVLHILANATSQVHERLGVWQSFKPKLQVVARFLHYGYYRSRLKSTCFGKQTRFSSFASFFDTACPLPIEWRWLVTQQVLQHILGLEHALLAGWNLQLFLGGSEAPEDDEAAAAGYRNRDAESSVSFSQVDDALKSADFWATAKMIWQLGETVREMEGWSKGCPCHPRDSQLSAFKQQAAYNAELERAASDQSDTCPGKGKRAPELAANKLCSLFEEVAQAHYAFVLSASQAVAPERRAELLRAALSRLRLSALIVAAHLCVTAWPDACSKVVSCCLL